MSKFNYGDTLEVFTLPLGLEDRQRRGYDHFRFTVGSIKTLEGVHFYAPDSSTYGWRARYLNKIEVEGKGL